MLLMCAGLVAPCKWFGFSIALMRFGMTVAGLFGVPFLYGITRARPHPDQQHLLGGMVSRIARVLAEGTGRVSTAYGTGAFRYGTAYGTGRVSTGTEEGTIGVSTARRTVREGSVRHGGRARGG